jgi:hypothetical protein
MFDWGKSSGVDYRATKLCFFPPPPDYRATKLCFFPPPPEYSKSDSYRSAEKKDSNESTIHTGPPNAMANLNS